MSDLFKFKEFSIDQDNCAMKVGTDGVLLGAWAEANKSDFILDIGTGTGLIALMLAQRFPEAEIQAVEIDEDAYRQAEINFKQSPWSERLTLHHQRIQEFASEQFFNLIIANPPFFEDSMKSGEQARDLARHTDQLAFTELIFCVNNLLKEGGSFAVIIPSEAEEHFVQLSRLQGLYCNKVCYVHPTPAKEAKRVMLIFNKFNGERLVEKLIIESDGRHQYSDEYVNLTKTFYLKM